MRIGALAETVGISTKTVRYYESIGLLPEPDRTGTGYRSYDDDAVERLRFVRQAQATGLSLTEIASVLEIKDAGASSCAHTLELVERHIAELDERIERLRTTRSELVRLSREARRLDPADCTDPNRCQVISGTDAEVTSDGNGGRAAVS